MRLLLAGAAMLLLVVHADASAQELLLFDGEDHETFIGCLNCSRYEAESVCNRYGDFGSRYSELSIWNRYGDYGSRYSDKSPWNRYATSPPFIVDRDGTFYGYMTAARFFQRRTRIEGLLSFLDSDLVRTDLQAARDSFCEA